MRVGSLAAPMCSCRQPLPSERGGAVWHHGGHATAAPIVSVSLAGPAVRGRAPSRPMTPRVSVVIPCYNLGAYLNEALDSVRAQTFTNYDVIVVDDGSTDPQTVTALNQIESAGARVLRTANHGLSAARNAGIAATTGELVCCLDADDRLAPEWLERGVALLDADAGLSFASHWLRTFGDEAWAWQPVRSDLAALLDVNTVNGAALIRRQAVIAVGGFDESMRDGCEDWEFWIRMMEAGYRGAIIPEFLYEYRRRPESMSRAMNRDEAHLQLYTALIDRHRTAYQQHLTDLLLRREWTMSTLAGSIEALETEISVSLEPALAERRLECERAKARVDEIRRVRDLEQEVQRQRVDAEQREWQLAETSRRAEWLASEREALLTAIAASETERRTLTAAEQSRLLNEVHRSWSWRLTAPLRAVAGWWRRG
jgi:GT2 family glycosyltransferase